MAKKSFILGAITALLIGFVAYALSAQPLDHQFGDKWSGGPDMSRRFETVAQFLDLDADQADQWLQTISDQQARAALRRDEIRELRNHFEEQAILEDPDLERLGQISLEIYNALQSSRLERDQIRTDLQSILTPEQQDRFKALEAAREFSGPQSRRHGRRPPLEDSGD